jgi:ABC-type transport system involved in multi-copper enzyme maturation permease subunit
MPVYEQGYEVYTGDRLPLNRRWWPLFREEILPYFRRRVFVFLLVVALLPWMYGVALTFLHTQLGDADWAKDLVKQLPVVDEKLVAKLLTNGYDLFLLFIVSIWVGSGLVSRDRKDMTLDVFLGRAVSSFQYLWAKGAALGAFLLIFSLLPTLVLVIFQVGLTGDAAWLFSHARILWGTLLYTAIGPGVIVLFTLALSSMARSPRVVGLAFIALVFFGDIACGIVYAITKVTSVWFFSLSRELTALAHLCLGAPAPFASADLHPALVALYFIGLAAASVAVLVVRFSRRAVLQ